MRRNGLLTIFIAAIFFLSSPIYAATPVNNGPKISDADVHIAFSLPDTCVDDDWADPILFPPGTNVTFPGDPDPHTIGTDAFPTINAAFAATSANATIYVAPGTYSEGLVVNKPVSIVGSGKGTHPLYDTVWYNSVSNVAVIGSDNVAIKNLRLTTNNSNYNSIYCDSSISNLILEDLAISRCLNGIYFNFQAKLKNITIRNCDINFTINSGIYFNRNNPTGESVSLDGMVVENCDINNTLFGFYVCQPILPPPTRNNDFKNLRIYNSRFERILYKGLFFEKLSDAIFNNLTIVDCGTSTTFTYPAGFELNLKHGDFSNVLINNCSFIRCGLHPSNTFSLAIKARADDSYSINPAKLTGVTVANCTITDGILGILVYSAVSNVSIQGTNISGCSGGIMAVGTTGLSILRSAIIDNNKPVPSIISPPVTFPPVNPSDTFGVLISGIPYPSTQFGPLWQPTDAVIESSIFCGNTNAALVNIDEVLNVAQYGYESSKIDARRNWWGSNSGPSGFGPGNGDPIGPSGIKYGPWIVMRIRALSSSIVVGGYSTPVMVDFHSDLDGGTVSPDILDGILTVELSTNLGLINGGTSTILLINGGGASATLTSGEIIGIADLRAVSIQSPSGEPAQGEVQIVGEVNLQLRKWVKKSTCNVDEKAVFYISVSNAGTVDAINVVLYDNFPNELVYDTSRPTGAQGINGVNLRSEDLRLARQGLSRLHSSLTRTSSFLATA